MIYIDADELRELVSPLKAVEALENALLEGLDPENDSPRLFSRRNKGDWLLMPLSSSGYEGVKVITLTPSNASQGKPVVRGLYNLFAAEDGQPLAVVDGAELTRIRTPATTALAVKTMAAGTPDFPSTPNIVVLGTSVQGIAHVKTFSAVFSGARFRIVGRDWEKTVKVASELSVDGFSVEPAKSLHDCGKADVIICATSSKSPILEVKDVAVDTIVAAVGTHGLESAELHPALVKSAQVVCEGHAASLRENGDLVGIMEQTEDNAPGEKLSMRWKKKPLSLAEIVCGTFARDPDKPAIFSGCGMAWEDLVVASIAFESARGKSR